jgi:uncharacterized repeat protein (TIGR01451 family)
MIAGSGGSVIVTFDVLVNSPFPASVSQVANQGAVTATGDPGTLTDDPDTPQPGDPTRTPIDRQADLRLTKTADTATPDFGGAVVFTLTLTNDGPSPAIAVVTDRLPEGLTYVSDDGGGAYDPATGEWPPGPLAVGAGATLQITARVETTLPVTNTAEVTFSSLPDPDSTPGDGTGDDYASASITPVAADLALSKKVIAFSGEANGPGAGDDTVTATFLLTVTNHGPSTATGVVVDEPGPDGATLGAATPDQGAYDPVSGLWTVGTLPEGGSASLVITFTASASNNLYNLAEVSAAEPDPDASNNLAGAHAQHDPDDLDRFTADLSLEKTVDESTPGVGAEIVYTLRVRNDGPSTTAGVAVRDSLPAEVAFVSAEVTSAAGQCPACGYDPTSGLWTVDHLPRDSTAVLAITVRVEGTGAITNTAEVVESHLPDPDSVFDNDDPQEDDRATAVITVATGKATSAVRSGEDGSVRRYELGSNYPNPFNPETVIPLSLPAARHVTVEVYNLLGQRVALLLDASLSAGRHEVVWRAEDQPSGVYLVRMRAGTMEKIQRITLMK